MTALFIIWTVWVQSWRRGLGQVLPHRPVPYAQRQSSTTTFRQRCPSGLITCCARHDSFYWFLSISVSPRLSPVHPWSACFSVFCGIFSVLASLASGPDSNNDTRNPALSFNSKQVQKVVEWFLWIEWYVISLVLRQLSPHANNEGLVGWMCLMGF